MSNTTKSRVYPFKSQHKENRRMGKYSRNMEERLHNLETSIPLSEYIATADNSKSELHDLIRGQLCDRNY